MIIMDLQAVFMKWTVIDSAYANTVKEQADYILSC